MIHVYYGQDKNNIQFERSNLITDNVVQIDFCDNHDEILNIISQDSLFDNENIFFINDASFLQNKKPNDCYLIERLQKIDKQIYCFNYDDKIDIKIPYLVYHKISKFNNLSKQKLITQLLNKLKINFDTQTSRLHFESMIENDPFVVSSELNKLFLSSKDGLITKNQIDSTISPLHNPNIFKMLMFLLLNQKDKLIKLYDDLILSKFVPIDLISIINTQLLGLKIYKVAKANQWSNIDIINKLHLNQYSIMQFDNYGTDINKINQLIMDLWELEYNMKYNNVNQYLAFKFFLAK